MYSALSRRDAPPDRHREITGDGSEETGPASLVDVAPSTSSHRPLAPSPGAARSRIAVSVSKIEPKGVTSCDRKRIKNSSTLSHEHVLIVISEL